ncbi:MAG: 30S ribosomal protein S20 [Planctomycetes bacterium]|nr:30S ribosomal protein S20 [Planctomycetota bacterium]
MANSVSARKRIRQNEARNAMNKSRKSAFRTEVKKLLTLASKGNVSGAREHLATAMSTIDKAAKKRSIHPNAAARYKSRLQRAIQRAEKGATSKG